MPTLRTATILFGAANLICAMGLLYLPLAGALFYPHGCFGLTGFFSCFFEMRGLALGGLALGFLAFVYLVPWRKPLIPYTSAILVLVLFVSIALAGLLEEGVTFVLVPLVLTIPAVFILYFTWQHRR